ncbi:tubulin tyrosine ligase like 4 [Rhinolophus ferrumequinum]|uniref:Tubulin tyrosine ligase like 4 n=1 Tax=Rhinolophus ferrumequinum TaxID=59479 RepID=A0A671ESR4_RHIFE|nr:tubulin monoglutamylase TTLL4 isoform X1 [Rhinolophus ferrumequinum]XP_032968309.1 tubulin monoglutamylase TTLL4 isoform X1 [Rhinolophus ferrumequinum]KAF6362355.1 tubulin tyrosine ligase like 4 [Rhinolophus ferrumequinum]
MASAGTEHYSIGLRQGNGFKQTGPVGPTPALPPEKRCEGKVWPQAHQQVKPIWKLEKKHVGTLSAELGPPQPACFFCPSTLCSPGPTTVLAGHGNSCYLHSLPDLVSHTLLYRRSNCRHKTYQQLESFCLRSSPSERRSFSVPQKSFTVRLTANQASSLPVSPMAQPTASSSTDPYFSLGAAGEIPSGNSLASAISGKIPSPLSFSSSSYKPMLNNNSFMRPNSTKVPLSQATEGLKPLSSPRIHLASWHHSGGTGDCVLQPIEHKVPHKSNGTVLEDALARSTLASPSSLDTSATSVASPQSNQSNLATRAKPHPFGLDGDSASQALSREVRFTEAVRKLTARGLEPPRQGCQFDQSCFMNPSLQWDLNRNRQWKPPAVDPPFSQEDAGADGRTLPGASDALELDSTVFCTKRISIHLLASHANGLSHSPACGSATDSPPLREDKIPVLPSPPQPCGLADVATRLSSIHLGQLGKEGPKEARELDSSSREIGSAADLQPDQAEAEDVEEELGDGLEDCCSHDENEEEEGNSECSSPSAVSPSGSIAVISRSCMEILTKPLSSEKVVRPALIYSLFPNVPPTIYFSTRDERVEKLPWEQRKLLRWKMSAVTPNIVKQTIGRSHFKISKKNDDWLGCWGHHMKSPGFRSIREHQKLNHFPGSFQIGRKDRLWRNLSRMQSRFGKKEFSFFPQSFILPQDAKLLRKAWESSRRQKWIVKPPASARGIGIQVIHKWSQLPKRRPLLVQRYLHKPYLISGSKFDLRIYVYVTSYDPLRIYLFSDGLVRFASCKYSPSMKSLGNKFMHLTNYSVNKKNAEYQANADETACQGHKWALKALWNYLSQKGVNSDAIWEKIKDVVVKTIISSEPYVTSLLKMYVRRPYSCHELFGFDIMLDENLKPWVLEVNISPSLHSNSPLDISIKGQMIRDLLNLAGFVLPNAEDIVSSSSSSSSSTTSLPISPRDKCQMAPEHFTAQKMKKAYYLSQKTPDQDFYASVLDVLTPDDVRVLVEMEDEFSRRGQFERIFPSRISSRYLRFFEQPRYFNILTTQWEQKYHGNKLKGLDLLRSWCYEGFHTGTISDSAPMWSLPTSLLTGSKCDMTLSAYSKSETGKLGKHSSSEGIMPLPNDGTTPKPKKTQADLSSFLRNPISSKDSEDTSKEPSLSTHKYSGQTLTLSASPTSQSTGDPLLAAVSP